MWSQLPFVRVIKVDITKPTGALLIAYILPFDWVHTTPYRLFYEGTESDHYMFCLYLGHPIPQRPWDQRIGNAQSIAEIAGQLTHPFELELFPARLITGFGMHHIGADNVERMRLQRKPLAVCSPISWRIAQHRPATFQFCQLM